MSWLIEEMNAHMRTKRNSKQKDKRRRSDYQGKVETRQIAALATKLGVKLTPKPYEGDGRSVELDGHGELEGGRQVLVEAFAHDGGVKDGQIKKIARDLLKLAVVADHIQTTTKSTPVLYLVCRDGVSKYLAGRSWLAAAAKSLEVTVWVAPLNVSVLKRLRKTQKDQGW